MVGVGRSRIKPQHSGRRAGILRKANLRRQLSCFGEERNAWSDGNNTLNQGRLSASSCSNGKMLENATKKRFESKSFEPCIWRWRILIHLIQGCQTVTLVWANKKSQCSQENQEVKVAHKMMGVYITFPQVLSTKRAPIPQMKNFKWQSRRNKAKQGKINLKDT